MPSTVSLFYTYKQTLSYVEEGNWLISPSRRRIGVDVPRLIVNTAAALTARGFLPGRRQSPEELGEVLFAVKGAVVTCPGVPKVC